MAQIWLKYYPAGVPAEIDIFRFASLKDRLEHNCARYPKHPAFTPMGVEISAPACSGPMQRAAPYWLGSANMMRPPEYA